MSPTEPGGVATEAAPPRWRAASWPILLALLVSLVYAPSVTNGFVYDDGVLIVNAPAPASAGEVLRVFGERHWKGLPYYRPIPRATMLWQKLLHGNDAAPYHLFNLSLMVLAALAAYGLLRHRAFGLPRGACFLGAALFAVHPLASETVYPIASGRETLIPALFSLLAVGCYLRRGPAAPVLASLLFAAALFSKEQAIVLPLVFALADRLGLSERPPAGARAWVARYLPLAAIVAFYLVLRAWLFAGSGEHRFVLHERPLGPLKSLLFALQSIVDPGVALAYEPRFEAWFSWIHAGVVLVVVAALGCWTWRRRADVRPRASFWIGWFLLALAPTANVFHQEAFFAERYVFLPSLGPIGLVLALAALSWDRPSFRGKFVPASLVLVVGYAALSVGRAESYRDELTFLERWVASDPGSAKAHHGLAQYHFAKKDYGLAREHFEWAVRLQPNYAGAHNNLGSLLAMQGERERAEQHFRAALEFEPDHHLALNNLARMLEVRGETTEAAQLFERSLAIEPGDATVHAALGQLLYRRGDSEGALARFDEAARLDPDLASVQFALGKIWLDRGDRRKAEFHFDRAALLDPGLAAAHNNLGMLLALRQERDRARVHFEKALAARPNYVEAHVNLGNLVLQAGDVEGAFAHYDEALRIDPGSKIARDSKARLAAALAERGP